MEKITFAEYIRNPAGGRSRLVGEQEIAQKTYNEKFAKMMLNCAGKVSFMMWKEGTLAKLGERFCIYFMMPSESIKRFYYDVVIDFITEDDVKKRINNLDGYNVRFFSNDPNFVFTYAYAFNQKGLLVPECMNKLGKKALQTAPTITNPNNLAGYVKSIYFAYLFMKTRGLFNKLMWQAAGDVHQMKSFLNQKIPPFDDKLHTLQLYDKLTKAEAKGEKIKISQSDPKGLEKAIKGLENKTHMVEKVRRISSNLSNHKINKIKPIGKR